MEVTEMSDYDLAGEKEMLNRHIRQARAANMAGMAAACRRDLRAVQTEIDRRQHAASEGCSQ